jgi:hypothetical protein
MMKVDPSLGAAFGQVYCVKGGPIYCRLVVSVRILTSTKTSEVLLKAYGCGGP